MHFGVPSKQHRSTEESLFLIFRITARRLQIMLHDSTTFSFSHCTQLIPTVLSPQTVVGLTQTSQVLQVKKTRCRLLFRGFTRLALTSTSSEWTVSFNVRMNWTYQSKRGLRCSVSVFFSICRWRCKLCITVNLWFMRCCSYHARSPCACNRPLIVNG